MLDCYGVPVGLPALTRAISCRTSGQVGFDWPSLTPVLAKLKEELAELEERYASNPKDGGGQHAIEEEFGDLLFVIANVRPPSQDRSGECAACGEREVRPPLPFHRGAARRAGRSPAQSNLAEMDALWDAAKTKGL